MIFFDIVRKCHDYIRSKASSQSCSPKLRFFKIAIQSCRAKLLLKAAPVPQSCSPNLPYKAAPQKLFPKAPPQSGCPKAVMLQTCSPKRLPKAILQSGSHKLLREVATESCPSKLRPQSCSSKLRFFKVGIRRKLPRKAAPPSQGYCPKLLHKAIPQSWSPKLLSKVVPNSCSPKLLKLSQSCFLKLLPKAVVLQSNCSSMLLHSFKIAPHNSSPKLLSKVATKPRPKQARVIARSSQEVGTNLGGIEPGENRGTVMGLRYGTRTETAKWKCQKNAPISEFPVFPNSKIIGLFRCHCGSLKKVEQAFRTTDSGHIRFPF